MAQKRNIEKVFNEAEPISAEEKTAAAYNTSGVVSGTPKAESTERRTAQIETLQEKYNCIVIRFNLNIPKPVMNASLVPKCFEEGKRAISFVLKYKSETMEYIQTDEPSGTEGLWAVVSSGQELKKAMVAIEDSHTLGSFFDIDVFGHKGQKISRHQIGMEDRDNSIFSKYNMSENNHYSFKELSPSPNTVIESFFAKHYAKKTAQCAVRALLYEVCITPKPGLVDRDNSGSHQDMDIFTFIDSSCALIPYFEEITILAMQNEGTPPENLLAKLRFCGMAAENDMLEATNGINTHKGLIFSLGILCASYGYLYKNSPVCSEKALEMCAAIASPALNHDFKNKNIKTNGESLYERYQISGARGEAASGFASVKKYGLPVLENCIKAGLSINDAGVITLLNLMANVEDTNIISRGSLEIQSAIQNDMQKLLEKNLSPQELIHKSAEQNSRFTAQNISPGGCADLLAITLMLYFITDLQMP